MNSRADEWNPRTVILLIAARWKGLLLATIVGAATGWGVSFLKTPTYQADAVLIASEELLSSQAGSMGGLGSLGALGALAGITPGGERQQEAMATLKSRVLVEDYIREKNLLPILFASRWDSAKQKWKAEDPKKAPTLYDGFKLFDKQLRTISEEKKAGVVKISVEWKDPVLAMQWTRDFVDRTNQRLREQALDRSSRNLQYLNDQLEKTSVLEMRTALYKLIENEIKKAMVAQGSKDFAFRFVDPPVIPEKKAAPKRLMYLIGGWALGLLFYMARLYWQGLAKLD